MVRMLGSSGHAFLGSWPNTLIGVLLGFEFGSGLSSLTTCLAFDLSNLSGTTNIGAEVDGAAATG
jgi:hypothetical protein